MRKYKEAMKEQAEYFGLGNKNQVERIREQKVVRTKQRLLNKTPCEL